MKDKTKDIEVVGASQVKANEVSIPKGKSTPEKGETALEVSLESLENIAKTAHNVVGAYAVGLGGQHLPWIELTKDERIRGIEAVKLLKGGSKAASAIHDYWISSMISDGWVYGEVLSEEDKTHPLMLDYRNLPKEERTKDKLFSLVVKSF